jgi:hypothetical protein
MTKVPVQCPHCGREGTVDGACIEKRIRCKCKRCGNSFVLTLKPEEAPAVSKPGLNNSPADSERENAPLADVADAVSRVPLIWTPGNVILDLYEVKPFDDERSYAEGGMARVYRVHHRGWNLDMAVKSPLPEKLQLANDVANFEREAETWVKLVCIHTLSRATTCGGWGASRVYSPSSSPAEA